MKLAHLVMAHQDMPHIVRLAKVLKRFSDVFIHVDKLSDETELLREFQSDGHVFILENRYHCEWGGGIHC